MTTTRRTHKITANGKVFVVWAPTAYLTGGWDGREERIVICYDYRGTRNGLGVEEFGPIRRATNYDGPKTVAAQLIAQARELFNADHEAMIAQVEADRQAGVRFPQVRLIQKEVA